MKTYSVVLIGAGHRGNRYTNIMKNCPEKFKVVAVAEPIKGRRDAIQHKHNLPDDMCFTSWEEVLSKPKMADIVLICTMDNMHYEPAMKAIELGYDILLEKPAAQTAQECVDIAHATEKKGVRVLVCHVLRYAPFFKLTSNDVTVSGIYQKGAEKVTIYIDNEPHNATINKNDYSFELKVNLEDGTHKIYATQTIDGIESTKCADRFVVINELNGNPDYLQSQYDYNMIHQITNDDVVSFDEYQKVNCVTNKNGYGELLEYSVVVTDKSAGIKDAKLHYGVDSTITIELPAETYIENKNKITITVTNKSDGRPVKDVAIVVYETSNGTDIPEFEIGKTDEDGKLVAPSISVDISDLDDIDITRYDSSMDATITEKDGTYAGLLIQVLKQVITE